MGVSFPTSSTSLDDLIAAAQADPADDTVAMAEILRRFDGTTWAIANNATSEWNLRQDAAQGARLGLVRAVRAHTPGIEGFTSYARLYMKGEARRAVESMRTVEIACDPNVLLKPPAPARPGVIRQRNVQVDVQELFEFETVLDVLTAEQRDIVCDRYLGGRTVTDIARGLGISVPAVSQRLKTIHKVLRPAVLKAVAA
jgi:RNA polymerase sigma factor (sigma-70 family)